MALMTTAPRPGHPALPRSAVVLDIVIPVYNEETDLDRCVRALHEYLYSTIP
jgi:hypothetical protein